MRVDYAKQFPDGMRAMAALERAALARCEALTGLRSDVLSLDGLDLTDGADGSRGA